MAATQAMLGAIAGFGEHHPRTAVARSTLAALHDERGEHALALALASQAVNDLRASGARSAGLVSALRTLGVISAGLGDYYGALAHLKVALAHQRCTDALRSRPDAGPATAAIAQALAAVYWSVAPRLGEPRLRVKAMRLYRWALAAYQRSAGDHRAAIAAVLHDTACCRLAEGTSEPSSMLAHLHELLTLRMGLLGEGHQDVADSLELLGDANAQFGRWEDSAAALARAITIRRTASPSGHPLLAADLQTLGLAYAQLSKCDAAMTAIREAAAIEDERLQQVFSSGSAQQLGDAIRQVRDVMWVYRDVADRSGGEAATSWLCELLLRRHGLSRAAALLLRADAPPSHREELDGLRRDLAHVDAGLLQFQITVSEHARSDDRAIAIVRLQVLKEQLEQRITQTLASTGRSLVVPHLTIEAVRATLPLRSALVQYVRLSRTLQSVSQDELPDRNAEYFAVCVSHRGHAVVPLGPASVIELGIAEYRAALGIATPMDQAHLSDSATPTAVPEHGSTAVRDAIRMALHPSASEPLQLAGDEWAIGSQLAEVVFAPLAAHLDGIDRLMVVADGEIARLPLAILPLRRDLRVIDAFELSSLGSVRDLLIPRPAARSHRPVVVGNPNFDLTDGGQAPLPGYPLEALKGASAEAGDVARSLGVVPVVGADALVTSVTTLESPSVLHIATHATCWQFGKGTPVHNLDPSYVTNPLLRAGLMLAGANTWLTGGPTYDPAGRGVLFAQEVVAMDLRDTHMVVLSACETGLGHVFPGEGIVGLGHAFLVAGARTVVSSLWKVPDSVTADLMREFYRALLVDGADRSRALREAQLAIRKDHGSPFYWGAFVCEGEAGPLPALAFRSGEPPASECQPN